MANKKTPKNPLLIGIDDPDLLDPQRHYVDWTEDMDVRRTRPNGMDAITDAYWGKLPSDWPYQSKVVDPVIRTTLIEKDARLLNAKLRGRLVPREGSDLIKARINNAILDFQWDNANDGGTMLSKWHGMSQDTRMYASCFGLVKWRHTEDENGNVLFDGNEFYKLDLRNCGMDSHCDHIRNASWFQVREWAKVEDMESVNDIGNGEKMYPGLEELKKKMDLEIGSTSSDRRDSAYPNRALQLKGLTDRVGTDRAYPVVEVVTEYRKDRWITFSPKHKVILRDIPNPYKHRKIPIVQLRYYKLTGDPLGESEVEPVLPLWKAIQATLCGYLDNMNIHMQPPLKILDGKVRIETIVFGPEAQWLIDQPDAVTEYQGSGEAMQYFQTTYSSLKSAFNTAMGDLSQGISNIDPLNPQKTATEVTNSVKQQNTRDQMNQTSLAEALEDMMSMWLSNNQQFLFADPKKKEHIIRIVGSELYNYFQRAGLNEMQLTPESGQMIGDIIHQLDGNLSDGDLQSMISAGSVPQFPVFDNPDVKDPSKLNFKPKMTMNATGDGAELSVIPEDLDGNYDYIADVKSMSAGADHDQAEGIQSAIDGLTTNPVILQMLQAEGVKPKIKDLLVANFENKGLGDAERFFEKAAPPQAPGQPGQDPNMPPQMTPDQQAMNTPLNPMHPDEMPQQMPQDPSMGQQMPAGM